MDATAMLRELSKPLPRDEKITVIIERTARRAGLSYSRCFEIWYGRARRIEPAEIARISDALEQKKRLDARNELSELRLRLARLESLLALSDEEFHRDTIDQTRAALRRSR
jgi:hypothetical protein